MGREGYGRNCDDANIYAARVGEFEEISGESEEKECVGVIDVY